MVTKIDDLDRCIITFMDPEVTQLVSKKWGSLSTSFNDITRFYIGLKHLEPESRLKMFKWLYQTFIPNHLFIQCCESIRLRVRLIWREVVNDRNDDFFIIISQHLFQLSYYNYTWMIDDLHQVYYTTSKLNQAWLREQIIWKQYYNRVMAYKKNTGNIRLLSAL